MLGLQSKFWGKNIWSQKSQPALMLPIPPSPGDFLLEEPKKSEGGLGLGLRWVNEQGLQRYSSQGSLLLVSRLADPGEVREFALWVPEMEDSPWLSMETQLSTRRVGDMWFGDLWIFLTTLRHYLPILAKHPMLQETVTIVWGSYFSVAKSCKLFASRKSGKKIIIEDQMVRSVQR